MAIKTAQLWQAFKKKGPVVAICFSIVLVCLVFMYRHYTRGSTNDLIGMLETRLLDLRFLARGPLEPSNKIGILAIDEDSIQKFGRFPFPRSVYAQAFANLKEAGVQWIGLDVVFSEPERAELTDVLPSLNRIKAAKGKNSGQIIAEEFSVIDEIMATSPGDRSFAQTVQDYEKLVLGFFYYESKEEAEQLGDRKFKYKEYLEPAEVMAEYPQGKKLKDYPALNVHGLISNIPIIAESSENHGFFSNESTDAITRWVTMTRGVDGTLLPSLSLKMAANIKQQVPYAIFDPYGVETLLLMDEENEEKFTDVPLDPLGQGRILVNHLGPSKTIPHFSLQKAYNNDFTKAERKKLQGMSLLLGPTAIGINDQRPNPFDAAFMGVENHGAVIDNIVSGRFMKRSRNIYETEMALVIAIGVIFTLLMVFTRAMTSGITAALFLVGYYYFDKFYWFGRGEWVYIGMPFVEISAMYISTTLFKYMTEEKEKRQIKGAFAQYVSPDVVNELIEDPDALQLGGERKQATVFFSDVRGFTTISESLSPEMLCDLMNTYFTPMTAIIKNNRGTLDKYIGDAIMAFWGAPIQIPNHADLAAKSCIEMMFAMDQLKAVFKQKGFPPIDIGCGLNTGAMSIGNMGSGDRWQYTAMGDAVNLGARLEGTTKEYGVKILISEFTRNALSEGMFFTRDLDDIKVKGKNEPVKIFELMRPDYLPNPDSIKNLILEFEQGRIAYKAQDFKKAEKHFKACFLLNADDGPTGLYMKRVQDYLRQPPPKEWDGVYVRTTK